MSHFETCAVPFDLETSTEQKHLDELHPKKQALFRKKHAKEIADSGDPSGEKTYYDKAPLTPHYGQIVCISIGNVPKTASEKYADYLDGNGVLTFCQSDTVNEYSILRSAADVFDTLPITALLMAHNGLQFDIPFTVMRMMINDIDLPRPLKHAYFNKDRNNVSTRTKEWHNLTHFIDTKLILPDYPSLDLLCYLARVESPKDALTGAEVPKAFWARRYEEIAKYCPKDVVALQKVWQWIVKSFRL